MHERDKTMYFRAESDTFQAARILRKNMTICEKLLWDKLKGKQVCRLHFRRQHPIEFFIADFYCHEIRLVIEIDGEVHNENLEYDDGRSAEMEKFDIKIIRFKNDEVEKDIEKVISEIKNIVNDRLKVPLGGFRGKKYINIQIPI
jgi:very-short-patch-repair endonuclease